MPNILLTTYCNRRCPYCFAQEMMDDCGTPQMDFADLITIADIVMASGRPVASVLGGEPTLHPQFYDVIQYLLMRGIDLTIFTNGICNEKLTHQLKMMPPERKLHFVVNVNMPDIESEENLRSQESFLRQFSNCCDLGINYYRPEMDLTYYADLVEQLGMKNNKIRVGLAQPIAGAKNTYLHHKAYSQAGEQIVRLAEAVFLRGIRISLDCGFSLCSFTNDQLGRLIRCRAALKFVCKPAIDIAPGLWAWSCFPLAAQTRLHLNRMTKLSDLSNQFMTQITDSRASHVKGLFTQCNNCQYFEHHACDGGCLSHAMCNNLEQKDNVRV